jgi:hypothetical protein
MYVIPDQKKTKERVSIQKDRNDLKNKVSLHCGVFTPILLKY